MRKAENKLHNLGLNTEFLLWLEGKDDRLPRNDLHKIDDADFAVAIRTAAWLRQLPTQAIAPSSQTEWDRRYCILQSFLRQSLESTLLRIASDGASHLETLDRVLETLLPKSAWKPYRDDFMRLRKKGYADRRPADPMKLRRRTGGREESEQTGRMRAAVAYVGRVSHSPYVDLANFWNERSERQSYSAAGIMSRLRKGHLMRRTREHAESLVDHWQTIFEGKLMYAFCGPFPLSRELRDIFRDDKRAVREDQL